MQTSATPIARTTPLSLVVDNASDIVVVAPVLEEVANCWPILEPILKRATDRVAGYEPIDLLQLVMTGRMTMYVVRDKGRIVACAVTEIRRFPRSLALEVPFIAGRGLRRWWRPLLAVLDAQARAYWCATWKGTRHEQVAAQHKHRSERQSAGPAAGPVSAKYVAGRAGSGEPRRPPAGRAVPRRHHGYRLPEL